MKPAAVDTTRARSRTCSTRPEGLADAGRARGPTGRPDTGTGSSQQTRHHVRPGHAVRHVHDLPAATRSLNRAYDQTSSTTTRRPTAAEQARARRTSRLRWTNGDVPCMSRLRRARHDTARDPGRDGDRDDRLARGIRADRDRDDARRRDRRARRHRRSADASRWTTITRQLRSQVCAAQRLAGEVDAAPIDAGTPTSVDVLQRHGRREHRSGDTMPRPPTRAASRSRRGKLDRATSVERRSGRHAVGLDLSYGHYPPPRRRRA